MLAPKPWPSMATASYLAEIRADAVPAAWDVGGIVGRANICYGPLLQVAAKIVIEGKPVGKPYTGAFWRVIQDHKVAARFLMSC